MAKELKMMSIKELTEFKHTVQELIDNYSKQLITYGISDINTYLNQLNQEEKRLLDERLKAIQLINKIDKMIEKKISEYYD